MKAPYLIMAPPYRHNSAGVRALYELRRHLQERGFEVQIVQTGTAPAECIVVYPETVPGNPLGGKTIARYVLHYPGRLGGDKEYDSKEMIFTYHPDFYPGAPIMTVPVIEDFFRDEGRSRKGGCFWVGKGFNVPRIPETEGLTEITYDWPAERKGLAQLFNETEIFYSYDSRTMLTAEARRCGCKVIVIGQERQADIDEHFIENFDDQIGNFIEITQAAAEQRQQVSFGVMVNDLQRFNICLRQSEIRGDIHYVTTPESATKGLNKLLDIIEAEGSDIAVLTHQDMFYRHDWIENVKSQVAKLPDNWVVAGVIGKDAQGRMCGRFHDMRIPLHFDSSDIHDFPHPACCFDEAVIIVNMKSGFRFDEAMGGFDLYGTLAVLQTWECGQTAWIIDAFCEHYCMRPFSWCPEQPFIDNYKWLHDRFNKLGRVDSTVLGVLEEDKAFFTSAE